jgi:hypothetical protein
MVNGVATDVGLGERRMLPYQEPFRTWAGHGTGILCNLCGIPIRTTDIEYEVELLSPAGSPRGLHFHFNCYREWESQ